MMIRVVLLVYVSVLALVAKVHSQSQLLRWCVEENGICHQNWDCCDKMLCRDHVGVGKCIPLTTTTTYPAPWPAPVPAVPVLWYGPSWYGPYIPLKPKKKLKLKKKKKTKILIRVAGDLTGLTVKAKKKNDLLQSKKGRPTHKSWP